MIRLLQSFCGQGGDRISRWNPGQRGFSGVTEGATTEVTAPEAGAEVRRHKCDPGGCREHAVGKVVTALDLVSLSAQR